MKSGGQFLVMFICLTVRMIKRNQEEDEKDPKKEEKKRKGKERKSKAELDEQKLRSSIDWLPID